MHEYMQIYVIFSFVSDCCKSPCSAHATNQGRHCMAWRHLGIKSWLYNVIRHKIFGHQVNKISGNVWSSDGSKVLCTKSMTALARARLMAVLKQPSPSRPESASWVDARCVHLPMYPVRRISKDSWPQHRQPKVYNGCRFARNTAKNTLIETGHHYRFNSFQ